MRKDWTDAIQVDVDPSFADRRTDAVVLRVQTQKVVTPLKLTAEWTRGEDLLVLGFQPDKNKFSGCDVHSLQCAIPHNFPVAPYDATNVSEPVLRLVPVGQEAPLGHGLSGGPVFSVSREGSPVIGFVKAVEPLDLRLPEIRVTAVRWIRGLLERLPKSAEVLGLSSRPAAPRSRYSRVTMAALTVAAILVAILTVGLVRSGGPNPESTRTISDSGSRPVLPGLESTGTSGSQDPRAAAPAASEILALAQRDSVPPATLGAEAVVMELGRLTSGYDMGVNSSDARTGWLTRGQGELVMSYPQGQQWGAVFVTVGKPRDVGRPGRDFSGYKTLIVELKGEKGGETVEVGIKDNADLDDGSETKRQVRLTRDWQTVETPLSFFKTADRSSLYVVTEFVFSEEHAVTISVRRIALRR